MKITGNEPAMPFESKHMANLSSEDFIGLTIRQQFAMAADVSWDEAWNVLVKIHPNPDKITADNVAYTVAELKVKIADALINELNKSEQ